MPDTTPTLSDLAILLQRPMEEYQRLAHYAGKHDHFVRAGHALLVLRQLIEAAVTVTDEMAELRLRLDALAGAPELEPIDGESA